MIRAGIVGGSGYTGIELIRLLFNHPEAVITAVSSRKLNNKRVDSVFPSLIGQSDLMFSSFDNKEFDTCDVVFFATPHGVAMEAVATFINKNIKVIDLSADFRVSDAKLWSKWYGMEHTQTTLLSNAVYGLPENNRSLIKNADLVANPGCYPTAVQLALKPLLDNGLIDINNIIADCKSGVSGAGRASNQKILLCEASESFKAYGVDGHRHFVEIQQELEIMATTKVGLTFVPHLVPMIRGIYATIYVDLIDKNTDIMSIFNKTYLHEPFVTVLKAGTYPETRSVRGSNFCQIALQKTANDKLIVMAVIDNLVKGASGQAVQNMNIMFNIAENSGLQQIGLVP